MDGAIVWDGQKKKTKGKSKRNEKAKRGANIIRRKLISIVVKKIRKRANEGILEKENSKKNERI